MVETPSGRRTNSGGHFARDAGNQPEAATAYITFTDVFDALPPPRRVVADDTTAPDSWALLNDDEHDGNRLDRA
jgi:hypothetical protein